MSLSDLWPIVTLSLSNQVNQLFTFTMLVLFVTAFAFHFRWQFAAGPRAQQIASSAPSLLPTLGILGTFVGICVGLLNFDPGSIDKSVPGLLAGMKTSFVTSVVGVVLAVVLRLISALTPSAETQVATAEDALSAIVSHLAAQKEHNERLADVVSKIRTAIAGDVDSSLVTQIQNLRIESRDGQNLLIKEFRDFAQTMAEQNSKALIEALRDVIKDFNAKLTEQFGENFKALNAAVHELVTWQQNYRSQLEHWRDVSRKELETLRQFIEASNSSLDRCAVSMTSIEANTRPIVQTMHDLKALISAVDDQRRSIEGGLTGLAELREKAAIAIPEAKQEINKLIQTLGSGSTAFLGATRKSVSENDRALETQRKSVETMLHKSQQSFENLIKTTTDNLTKQVENLDRSMQDELKRCIEKMGGHLASLSKKMVEDYTPLTERLRKVVEISARSTAV